MSEPAPELVAAWDAAVAAWDDAARHDAVIAAAAAHRAFAWAAARYRERGEDPVAARQLDRLQRAATATMMATATPRAGDTDGKQPYRATVIMFIVLMVVAIGGLVYAGYVRARAPHAPPTHAQP